MVPGDTLSTSSEVIGLKQNSNGKSGVVYVRSTAVNQRGEVALEWARWVMVHKRDLDAPAPETVVPELASAVAPADLVIPTGLDLSSYDLAAAGSPHRWDDYVIGEKIDHEGHGAAQLPGTGCGAREGLNRIHAIFGWSDACVATYPGDMANALYAHDASVRVRATDGGERGSERREQERQGDRGGVTRRRGRTRRDAQIPIGCQTVFASTNAVIRESPGSAVQSGSVAGGRSTRLTVQAASRSNSMACPAGAPVRSMASSTVAAP